MTSIDLSLLDYLKKDTKITIFADLVKNKQFDLANQVYQAFHLDNEKNKDFGWNLIVSIHSYLKDVPLEWNFKQEILKLNLKYTKESIIEAVSNREIYYLNNLFIQPEIIHELFELGQLLNKKEKSTWYSEIIEKMPLDVFIDFNGKDKDVLSYLDSLKGNSSQKLLAQSNAFEYLELSNDYFKKHSFISNYDGGYFSDVGGRFDENVESISSKVVIVLNALDHVKHPKFKEFLTYFQMNNEEIDLMKIALCECSMLSMNLENMKIFLNHYHLSLSHLISEQIKEHHESSEVFDLAFILNSQKSIEHYSEILSQEKKKITSFTKSDSLFFYFETMDELFDLGCEQDSLDSHKAHQNLVNFLKLTTLNKKGMTDGQVLYRFYEKMNDKSRINFYNCYFKPEAFEKYLVLLEKEVLHLSLSEKNQTTPKKMKI
jgi:hypothetical protein